jgi:glutamine amidotransferase
MNTVAVIDYGMGNLHSVAKALEHAGDARVVVSHDQKVIAAADRVVLPGVGAIRDCMAEIQRLELDDLILELVRNKPFLGVCVGMQALMDHSAENGGTQCLGVLPGNVEFFGNNLVDPESGTALKVPHMGWNQVHQEKPHPLWKDIPQDERFYFVHSYYVKTASDDILAASCRHGLGFAAAVMRDNIFATQFHPEKSQHAGLQLYANFLNWNGEV